MPSSRRELKLMVVALKKQESNIEEWQIKHTSNVNAGS